MISQLPLAVFNYLFIYMDMLCVIVCLYVCWGEGRLLMIFVHLCSLPLVSLWMGFERPSVREGYGLCPEGKTHQNSKPRTSWK